MAYLEFDEFPDLIEYYTTIGNVTLLKEEYNKIKECTLLKDIEHFMYLTQSYFSDNTPNQILRIMSTLLLWSKSIFLRQHTQPNPTHNEYTTIVVKRFYTTIGQQSTLYNFLTIT